MRRSALVENKQPTASQLFLKSLANITTTIKLVFSYDPRLVFIDSFEKISQQLSNVIDLINAVTKDPKDYWVIYDIVIAVMPICEQIIFNGYADQILEFLLNINSILSVILIFCTSRFIPFRLQLFSTICSAFANTEETREKDADLFIQSFKNDILQLKQLESSNVNGLTEAILLCTGEKCNLKTLFETALNAIELMSVHFNTEEIVFERSGSSRKIAKKPQKRQVKDEPPQSFPPPPPHTINLICNAYNSPVSKSDYISKYGQAIQAWTNGECQLAPSLLYRLIYSFLKAGKTLEGYETLSSSLPDDKIVQLAVSISTEQWIETSDKISKLTKEEISSDYQFYNEIAAKLWKLYISNEVSDPNILKGVLHVLILSPNSCPMQISMAALHYCWYLVKSERYDESVENAKATINILEDYRDIFTIRTIKRVLPSMTKIPNKPISDDYKLFNKWIECLHTDLLTVYIQSKLKYGVQIDTEKARIKFIEDIERTKQECQKTKELYGTLSIKQKEKFDSLLNCQFKAPEYSMETEDFLINQFKNNGMALALLYTQMSFFRPNKASMFLEKARKALTEYESSLPPINSPILYINRTEIGLLYPYSTPEAKTVAVFGKETVGSTGLTISNTALNGTGIKQDMIEPFIITKLKPNTLYTFGFGAFDSQNELIDNLTSSFPAITCHSLSFELIYSYMASASYHLHDVPTFDISLTYLLSQFVDVVQISDDHSYFSNINPFNKFAIKQSTFNQPAPMLRAFSTSLMMAARLFINKPLHAASFEKLAIILSQTLQNYDLVLQICSELFSILQPLLVNSYNTKWVVHPLIYIINTLKNNKHTQKAEPHQILLAKASFVLDSLLVQYYQERQLTGFVMNSVVELQSNPYRTAFILFASKNKLLENNVNDSTLPLVAAEMFRTSPEKSFDDLFAKFKADPQFLPCAVYLVTAAHHCGYCTQAITWCSNALEYIKTTLQEPDDIKSQKKAPSRANSKVQQKRKPTIGRGKKNEPITKSPDEENEIQAATKIQSVWNKFKRRQNNLSKFKTANKYRAALNLLMGVCMIETDSHVSNIQESTKSSKKDPKHQTKGRVSKHSSPIKKSSSQIDEYPAISDNAFNIINTLRRSIVIGNRVNDFQVIKSASTFLQVYLSSLNSNSFNVLSPILSSLCSILIRYTQLEQEYSQKLLKEIFVLMLYDNQIENIKLNMIDACSICNTSGQFYWMISNQQNIPNELIKINETLRKRDPSENQFYDADSIYQRYKLSPNILELEMVDKSVHDVAIQLQHKQKLSLSVCLLTKLAFLLFDNNQNQIANLRLCEALEGHFRLVKAHEKIDSLLQNETLSNFYSKHSWSGCISIFVICSLLSYSFDHKRAMQLIRLAAFSIASLFTSCSFNPIKQIDFCDYEPSEIIPGVDIFSEYDPHNPLLECPPLEYITISISILLSSMLSYEMYFEMFKPLSFAKHFFRFILKDKKYLARTRLMNVIACAQFGFLNQAISLINDVLTNYGDPRITKDTSLSCNTAVKRLTFDVTDISNNIETIKSIASIPNVNLIQLQYGFSISCLYVLSISKILQNISSCSDPSMIVVNKTGNVSSRNTKHSANKKVHSANNKNNTDQLTPNIGDSFEGSLKIAENLVNEMLSKEFKAEQKNIKLELEIEKSLLFMNQWCWEDSILIAQSIIKCGPSKTSLKSCYLDHSCLLPTSFVTISSTIISKASFNLHDYGNAVKFASPYLKSLLFIQKADYESAVDLLTKITLHPPITAFHKEYVLSVAQLVQLFCFNNKLFDIQKKYPNLLNPVDLINKLDLDTYSFFVNQLGMNETRSFYLRNTHLLIRIKHLVAIAIQKFNGLQNSIEVIQKAQELMSEKCPFISHGLSFLLSSSYCRIQVQSLLMSNPLLIQLWNKETNPLTTFAQPELIDKIIDIQNNIFCNSPDCIVNPESEQCILDYSFLVGISSNSKKLELSFLALQAASVIRSSHRFIQSLIVQCPNNNQPPTTCPSLLLNENKDAKLRTIAASYYSHVCGLNVPYFDSEILEMRTLFYFKCFEEQCNQFKVMQKSADQIASMEAGQILGQWYLIDSKLLNSSNATPATTGKSMLSSRRPPSQATSRGFTSNCTTISRPSTAMSRTRNTAKSISKGSLSFFICIIINGDENPIKKVPKSTTKNKDLSSTNSSLTENVNRFIPLLLVSQAPDLREITNDMAEVGLALEDVNRMESSEAQGEAPPPKEEKDDPKKKRKPATKTKSMTNTETHQPVSLLKNQAQISLTNADIKWKDASHKAVALFNKSNRIFGTITQQKNRYPAQVSMDTIEMSNSTMLSHFFNTQYGINEKAPQFAEWLTQNFTTATFTSG